MGREEEYAIHRRIRSGGAEGRAAFEEFVNRNLRLVIVVAFKYRGLGLPIPDLMQEGNLGLLKAIEKFEPDFGFKFSTYATWWIRQSIIRAVHSSGLIKIPSFMVTAKYQVPKIDEYIGHTASDVELSEIIGSSLSAVSRLRTLPEVTDSIYSPLGIGGDKSDLTILETLSDGRLYESELLEGINCSQAFSTLKKTLGRANPRDVEILRVWASEDSTLQSVAERYELSRERVRQVISSLIEDVRVEMGIITPKDRKSRTRRNKVNPNPSVGKDNT